MQLSDFLEYGLIFDKYFYFIDSSYFTAKTLHSKVATDWLYYNATSAYR